MQLKLSVDYLKQLVEKEGSVSKELLDGFYKSQNIENKIDSLQSTYEKIYQIEKSLDWIVRKK